VSKSILCLILMAVCLQAVGCDSMPGEKKMVDVTAEYLGLADQRVAVMVAADSHMLYQYPSAPDNVCRAVTAAIAKNVPGVTTTIPDEVTAFQQANPYWINMRYGKLAEHLNVDKIVLIDLIEYQTHEPGNAHIWQGLITANIGVIDAGAQDPDNFVYQNTVGAKFPEESTIGLIDSDDETIELGMVFLFTRKGAGLFYDHQVEVD
jgi:hypothetical protein